MNTHKYVLFFSCKDEEGVVRDHLLRSFETEYEIDLYLVGYIDAVLNHTDDKNIAYEDIYKLFRKSKIGEENVSIKTGDANPSKIKTQNSEIKT